MKRFLRYSNNISRDSYLWNMTGSILTALQSVFMLIILMRILGLKEAGIFTIACANANLFLTIGKYGMRNYQVSDINEEFTFNQYASSRLITSFLMLFVSVVYVLFMRYQYAYTVDKSLTIIWMCLLKLIDALEDVFHGRYQQKGRLDVAGKALTLRMAITILTFGICLIILRNLLLSLQITFLCSFSAFLLLLKCTCADFQCYEYHFDMKSVSRLLKICFPLFMSSFLSFYICNAPKYAIDHMLTDELQACYGFISMPVFVIELLNGFIFNPVLKKVSEFWYDRKIDSFISIILVQIVIITCITVICLLGAYFCGIPLLSLLYHANLTPYKSDLLILILGGGFLALSGYLTTIITILREQRKLMYGYLIVALLAFIFSDRIVAAYQIFGASLLYTVLMALLSLMFGLFLCYFISKYIKSVL